MIFLVEDVKHLRRYTVLCNSNHVLGDNDFDFFSDSVDTPETHDAERVLLSVVTRCVCVCVLYIC